MSIEQIYRLAEENYHPELSQREINERSEKDYSEVSPMFTSNDKYEYGRRK